jgi:hypothetical protein
MFASHNTGTLGDEEVLQWRVQEVVRWLQQNGYSDETTDGIENAKVDGKCLLRSSAEVLQAMGVVRLGERKRLVKAIGEIESTCVWSWMGQEVDEWPVGAVALWLSLHGLQEYATVFVEQGVTGRLMLGITQQWLRDVGVAKFGHVKRILKLSRCYSCLRGEEGTTDRLLCVGRELSLAPQERLDAKARAEHWTLGDVCDWLRVIGMSQHLHLFVHLAIDGPKILQLTDSKLKLMGVDALGHRKRIMKHVRQLHSQYVLDGP